MGPCELNCRDCDTCPDNPTGIAINYSKVMITKE
jgi:hypothetical protein